MRENSLRVVARMVARPEGVEEVRSILAGLIGPTRAERGCVGYELLQNRSDPTDFTFVEEWEDDAALDAHLSAGHIRDALSRLPALLAAEPDIRRYSVVGPRDE
jgi:quinol monooxygenase YgiN